MFFFFFKTSQLYSFLYVFKVDYIIDGPDCKFDDSRKQQPEHKLNWCQTRTPCRSCQFKWSKTVIKCGEKQVILKKRRQTAELKKSLKGHRWTGSVVWFSTHVISVWNKPDTNCHHATLLLSQITDAHVSLCLSSSSSDSSSSIFPAVLTLHPTECGRKLVKMLKMMMMANIMITWGWCCCLPEKQTDSNWPELVL